MSLLAAPPSHDGHTMPLLPSRRLRALSAAVVALLTLGLLLHQTDSLGDLHATAVPPSSHSAATIISYHDGEDAPRRTTVMSSLGLPLDYTSKPADSEWCQERFGIRYLENMRDSSVSYCEPDAPSLSCFWSTTSKDRHDAMCHGRGAIYNTSLTRFQLGCQLRDLSFQEIEKGVVSVPQGLTKYWYETGPAVVMEKAVHLDADAGVGTPRTTSILVKREGNANLWHSMMELLSLSWTLDALQMSVDERQTESQRPFLSPDAASSTQVIFLDDYEDGPFIDMWQLFAKMPIRRLHQLTASEPATDIIIPFSGGSNPLWQGDWEELDCHESALLRAFVSRVLHLYNVPTPPRESKDVVARFIHRANTRRLINETALIDAVKLAVPHLTLEIVDFAGMPFSQQLQIVRETDLLIGVHGAGLTHLMFLPPGSAVVEILPGDFTHRGFRNLAQMLGHQYFRAHTRMHGEASGKAQWQQDAVEMDEGQLVRLVGGAALSLYNNGLKTYDVV